MQHKDFQSLEERRDTLLGWIIMAGGLGCAAIVLALFLLFHR